MSKKGKLTSYDNLDQSPRISSAERRRRMLEKMHRRYDPKGYDRILKRSELRASEFCKNLETKDETKDVKHCAVKLMQ